jgi:hypothetical protein
MANPDYAIDVGPVFTQPGKSTSNTFGVTYDIEWEFGISYTNLSYC